MKVFLSHSTKDADFVEKLATTLESNGFETFRCEVDIDKLENFVAKINDRLTQSDICLLVWSPNAAQSAWTKEEWTAGMARQVEGQKMRVGTVLLREDPAYPIPPLLKTKVWFDARSDQAAGIRDTITWLKERNSLQRLSGSKAPVYLPEYRPKDFVGRSAYLTSLRSEFSPEPGKLLLYGEPGSGKSTIALQFGWDEQKDLDAVIWQTCGQRSLDAITAELVARLPIEVATLPPDQQRTAAREWLRERPALLVLDDVWSTDVIALEAKGACSVLYTSRLQSLPGLAPKQVLKVEKFTESEAEELFHTYLDPEFSKDDVDKNRQALLDFAARVEMLPIAVAVGASLLRAKAASALGKAVLRLKLNELSDGAKDVNALFDRAIASQPPFEQKLLAACAVCVQEGFWLPLVAQIAELSDDDVDDAANVLVRGSLLRVLDRERQRFQMHALLRDQVRARLGEDALNPLLERHASALEALFKDWQTRWQECRECLDEITPAARRLHERQDDDRAWNLADRGYSAAERIGELDVGLRIMQQEEELAAARGDAKSLQACYRNQANILYAWGRLEEALQLLQKAEGIALELGDKEGLSACYGDQALVLTAWGRLEEALELLKKAEAIALELGNRDQLQRSYGNQALILADWGRLEEALALHKKEEAIALELGNKDQLQRSYGNQASLLIRQKKLTDALTLLTKQEAMCKELGNKDNLGGCYRIWADLDAARGDRAAQKEKLQQALALFTELKMPRERDKVRAELDQLNCAD